MKNCFLLIAVIIFGGCAQESAPEPIAAPDVSESEYSEDIVEDEKEATARVGVLVVEEAVQGYRLLSASKRFPDNLGQLVEEGMLASLPELPTGMQFVYDSETGEVGVMDVMKLDE